MNNVIQRTAGLLLAGILAASAFGCAKKEEITVTASGSTALLPLVTAAKERFEDQNETITINVSGGGSYNGLTQVASGAVDIGNSDVEATGDVAQGLVDHRVAVAPFMIIINKDVTAQGVTMTQLAQIFRGEITNWKEVGGADALITVISRQQSSGSRATIVAKVLQGQGDITTGAVIQDSNGKVKDGVATTPGAIGYVDAPYFDASAVGALQVDGVAYSPDAVINGQWPIYAFEHMYTKGEPTGATKSFLEFIMSQEFQESTVQQQGFIPITKMSK